MSAETFLSLYTELELIPEPSRTSTAAEPARPGAQTRSPDDSRTPPGGGPGHGGGGEPRAIVASANAGEAEGSESPGRQTSRIGSRYIPVSGPVAKRPYAGSAAADSVAAARVRDWWKSGWDFSGIRPPADAAGEMMRKKSGLADVFRPNAPRPKPEKNPVRFDFMPSEVHVRAMASVYRRQKPTQKDLYLDLDAGRPMTAALFNRELDFLVSKGFLTRKKISPENPLMLVTPVGAVPVEMSRLNRLNPVYEYKAQVDQSILRAYMQSQETRLRDRLVRAAVKDTAAVGRTLRECVRSLAALAEEK